MVKFTRKQYLDKECTHREYYGQFVTDGVKASVLRCVGNADRLAEHFRLEQEEFFHPKKIQVKIWDKLYMPPGVAEHMREAGDYLTSCGIVCIGKEAAKQIVEGK